MTKTNITVEHFQGSKSQRLNTKKIVFQAFYQEPRTCKEVMQETGILPSSQTGFICNWLRSEAIQMTGKRICVVTGNNVNTYTTNPDFMLPKTLDIDFSNEPK